MKYIAAKYTSVYPLGMIAKGATLTEEQAAALGEEAIADMVERGILTPADGARAKAEAPANAGLPPKATPGDDEASDAGEASAGDEELEELTGIDDLIAEEAAPEPPAEPPKKGRRRKST